jgi:antitoxin ParD1/3/4
MESDSLDISLSGSLKSFVETQAAAAGNSPGDYVLALIDAERQRKADEELDAALLDGLNSGPSIPVDDRYWDNERRLLGLPPRAAKPS